MTGADFPPPVKVRLTTAAGSLDHEAQRQVVLEMTRLVADAAGDPAVAERTLVLHSEVAEGGWGDGGRAFARKEFDELNAALRADNPVPDQARDRE
jgi:phenylpyruvate tautomerase PptA (4-oxalocrotonate tautomerase family)